MGKEYLGFILSPVQLAFMVTAIVRSHHLTTQNQDRDHQTLEYTADNS